MKSTVLYYGAFLFVVLSSVLFGLDWQPATMSAMPDVDVAAYVAPVPPPKPVVVTAAPAAQENLNKVIPAAPNMGAPTPVARSGNVPQGNPSQANLPQANLPQVNSQIVQTPPRPSCDVAACAAAYRSFRESDCTYNPSFGPRQLCTKGVVPNAAPGAATAASPAAVDAQPPLIVSPESGTQTQPAAQSNGACNVSACAAAYRSFRESDCTFNPSFGLRQLCKK